MKTMTCRQMGGPCDTQLHGNTPDEMSQSGMAHIQQLAEQGDEEHKKILAAMDDQEATKQWFEKFQADFSNLPDGPAQ